MKDKAAVVWTERGVWLQTVDEYGRLRLSDCGRLSLEAVMEFCEERGIELQVGSAASQASPMRSMQFRGDEVAYTVSRGS